MLSPQQSLIRFQNNNEPAKNCHVLLFGFFFIFSAGINHLSQTMERHKGLFTTVIFFISSLLPLMADAQLQGNCEALRKGSYYYYSDKYLYYGTFTRNDSTQIEINRLRNDTTVWGISWKDCQYTLTYISSTRESQPSQTTPEPIKVNIIQVTPDYYLYERVTGKKKDIFKITDTLWLTDRPEKFLNKKIKEGGFQGGDAAWVKYLNKAISRRTDELSRSKQEGICNISFVIDTDGSLTDIKATTMEKSAIARVGIDIMKNSPKWIPATIDGVPVRIVRMQPFKLQLHGENVEQ
jgi:hypothetical protein